MSETKEFTYSDVSEHASKKDLYIVVHDKVYDCTSFVDEHPYVAPYRQPICCPHHARPHVAPITLSAAQMAPYELLMLTHAQRW